jgi:hypothetical protein
MPGVSRYHAILQILPLQQLSPFLNLHFNSLHTDTCSRNLAFLEILSFYITTPADKAPVLHLVSMPCCRFEVHLYLP